MNKTRPSERLSGLLAFALSGVFYAIAGVLVLFLAQRAAVAPRPALGPKAVNLSFAQIELKAAKTPPPEPKPIPPPEKADVAIEEIPEKVNPEPLPAPAQVTQESAAPVAVIESPEPLAGTVAEVDWRAIAIASVRAMVEREKYYPEAARRAGYTGWCRVRIHLARDGIISSWAIEERRGHPLLGKAVETTLGKIQSRKIDARLPEAFDVLLTIEFSLN